MKHQTQKGMMGIKCEENLRQQDVTLLKNIEKVIDGTRKQRGCLKLNGNKKTHSQNDKDVAEILGTRSKKMDTHRTH